MPVAFFQICQSDAEGESISLSQEKGWKPIKLSVFLDEF
jgi:hypothetical protein